MRHIPQSPRSRSCRRLTLDVCRLALALVGLTLLAAGRPCRAQTPDPEWYPEWWPRTRADSLAEVRGALRTFTSSSDKERVLDVRKFLSGVARGRGNTPEVRSAALDGLEAIVRGSVPSSREVRWGATLMLASAGSVNATPPMTGMVARLERLYREVDHRDVRRFVVSSLIRQAERAAALAFLRSLLEKPTAGFPGEHRVVIGALMGRFGGRDGMALLRQIDRDGSAGYRAARNDLAQYLLMRDSRPDP